MKQRQSKNSNNKINQPVVRLLSILLRRLESLGLYSILKIRTSLGRRSSVVGSHNNILVIGLFFLASLSSVLLFSNNDVYAEYTLSMTSSGAQNINVMPGSSNNGHGIGTSIGVDNINITSTCKAGYNFAISTSVNDNNLYLSGDSSNNTSGTYFTPADGTTTLDNSANTWGYYYNPSAPTTSPTSSNIFSTVPVLGSNATIRTTSATASESNINDSFNIYYGVSVSGGLAPGTYTMIPDTNSSNGSGGYNNGSIVYYVTMDESCQTPYMQDLDTRDLAELMPNSGDTYTLYDKRDESDYQITNINGDYWMTQNLRITNTADQATGTILAENSNFSTNLAFDGDLTAGNAYNVKRYHIPTETDLSTLNLTSSQVGVWYNYCAASAGTVCDSTNQLDATEDICPAGWRLPTSTEFSGITSQALIFSPYNNGNYYSKALVTTYTYYWASNASSATNQYRLRYNGSALQSSTLNKRYGSSIRCIKKEDYADVTVNFASGITGVTLTNATYGTETITTSGTTVSLKMGEPYSATYSSGTGYIWLSDLGTLSSNTDNPTTYTINGVSDTLTITNEFSLSITFAGTGVSSVKVCKVSGNCSGDNLMGTISSSGGSVSGLTYGIAYYLYASYNTGYTLSSWAKTDSATGSSLSSTSASNPTYTIGAGNGAVTITGKAKTYSLTVTFAGTGVSNVQVRTASGTGGTLKGTISSSGGSVSGLTYNETYYLYPTFTSGYELDNWKKTSSYGALAGVTTTNTTTTTANPTFKMGAGNGTVTITGKSSKTYIQDLTLANCPANGMTVYDKRDEKDYTVKLINGECWMTQNLRITGTITSTDSNYSGTDYNISAYDLATDGTSGGNCYGQNGYNTPCTKNSNSTTTGVWYNYCAATVGTICDYSTSTTAATEDVCPANWHLPSGPSTTANTDFNKLVGNTTSGWQSPTDGLTAFGAVTGGYYNDGSLSSTWRGYWWSATPNTSPNRYYLGYNGSGVQFYGDGFNVRYYGIFVRCVRSS